MDAASSAINNFLSKAGQTTTTVDETVAPAVEHETITKTHEQKDQKVIDKEVHKDHYHTTVQPLKDTEVQPTQHDHVQAKTQYRDVEHDDPEKTKAKIDAQNNQFTDKVEEGATIEKRAEAETVSGEHVHHHLHETIQPIIEKETIKPSVTHKTIPIVERHHEESENHGVTRKEAISVDDFKKKLEGEATRSTADYEGKPEVVAQ